jgi:D-glycero-D-manno-heptose 1,7-bisphosphate phosphatase
MVLLDRDGTIGRCDPGEYILSPERFELLPGAGEGVRLMQDAGLRLAIVTNQAAVGRGWIDEPQLERIHDRMLDLLRGHGVDSIEGVFVCPHRPQDRCGCRKPATGLVDRAVERLGFDAARSFVVGDRAADMSMGQAVGATTVLVRSAQTEGEAIRGARFVADDLIATAAIVTRSLDAEERE